MPSVPDATVMGTLGSWVERVQSCSGPSGCAALREAGGCTPAGRRLSSAQGSVCKAAWLLCGGEGRGSPAQSRERDLGLLQMENGTEQFWLGACFREGGDRRKPDFLLPPETSAAPSADKKSRASDLWAEMP